jgi:nucleotide-binding universal stress UspA family protein
MTAPDNELLQYAGIVAQFDLCRDFLFVHVADPAQLAAGKTLEQMRIELDGQIAQWFVPNAPTVTTSSLVVKGVLIDALIDVAVEGETDLILMGHRKMRSGWRSLARRLAMLGPKAVWMVPEGAPLSITSILAPVDFSRHSAESLVLATTIASQCGLEECTALYVTFDPSSIRYEDHVAKWIGQQHADFDNFLANIPRTPTKINKLIEDSPKVTQSILRSLESQRADLMVMNTRGRSQAASVLLGSTTSELIKETPVPVLVIKNHGAHMTAFEALRESRFWKSINAKTN